MIDWAKEGEKILSRTNLGSQERALLESQIGAARLSAQSLAEAHSISRREASSLDNDNVVEAVKSEPYNPNVVTDFWAALLIAPDVIQCSYSSAELKDLAKKKRGPVYIPNFSYSDLEQKFPGLGSWAVEDSPVKDESETVGWTDIETALGAPYRRTTESQLQEKFAKEGRVGARLKTGILASKASKLLVGYYFDEAGITSSRYLGSRCRGRVVYACFDPDGGYLNIYSCLLPEDTSPDLGGRSEGTK